MKYPSNVERRYDPDSSYAEQALRHAPRWVIQAANKQRATRGLAPLARQAVVEPTVAFRAPPPPAAKTVAVSVLVGICAPFVSRPCATPRDARKLAERFTSSAWRLIIDETRSRAGNPLVLRAGHNDEALATMAGGAIELRFDPLVGAWFVARVTTRDSRRLRMLVDATFGCGVSVTFSKAVTKDVTTSRGLTVREIQSATLHDLSLVPSAGDARAVYEGARAYLAASDTPADIAVAFGRAKEWATRYGLSRI